MASFPRYHEQNFFHKNRKYPLDVLNRNCYTHLKFRRSSAVEQLTVNQLVVGSIPTAGAKNNTLAVNARCFFMPRNMCDPTSRLTIRGLMVRSRSTIPAKKWAANTTHELNYLRI
jgi:hypothetical protein